MNLDMTAPRFRFAAMLLLAAACVSETAGPRVVPDAVSAEHVRLDHLVVGVADIEAGMDAFERLTGVRPVFGGEHPNLGTHNALVSLGDGLYLELIAPRPDAELSPVFAFLAELDGLTPVMWAVATVDIDATVARIGAAGLAIGPPMPGSRRQADGTLLEWRVAGMAAPDDSSVPFLIEWGADAAHPSATSPSGCELLAFEVRDPDPERARALVGLLGLGVGVHRGERPSLAVELRSPRGDVSLGR
jgi:hypothetical protein